MINILPLKKSLNGTLDVSGMSELKYLSCGNNNLTGLNVSGLTNIETLQCANNKLTSLDVSGLTTLETLQCYNNLLTTIDLTGLINLKDFRCHLNSNLTEINGLSDCTNLELLLCAQCDLQGTLDVTNLEKLTRLACYTNKITTLVGLENKADIKELEIYTNNLQQLDVSGCQKLEKFWCNNNELSIINGLADCTVLKSFKGDRNNLTALDLSGVPDKCDLTYYNNRGFTENNCFTEVTLRTGTLKTENSVGGKGYISEIMLADNKVSLATNPETGYVFEGWYTDASLTDESKIDFDGNVSGTTTLYPKFSPIISNVIISNLPANITYGDSIDLKILEIDVASGYDVANATYKWYEGEDDFGTDSSNYTYTVNDTNEHTIICDITLGGYKVTKTFNFIASPKMINTEISLAAPVKNAVPQTNIETDEYTATVVWSPEVTSTFEKSTDYTATITIMPKANYTTNGITQNGYTVSGAVTVENNENSNVVTALFPRTSGSSSGGGGTTRYTISFETNGGSKVASRQVIRNTAMKEPTAPTKDGFDFAGWYTDKELKTKYDFTSNEIGRASCRERV